MHFSLIPLLVSPLVKAATLVPPVEASGHPLSSVAADATPKGRNITINGVLTYVSLPERFDPTKAILFLTDVFGLPSVDSPLLADQFADAGYAVYAPDYLNGDALPLDGNVTEWIVNHGEAQTTPPLLTVVNFLKNEGVKQIAATGYCFGGLYITRLVQNNTIVSGTTAHPSFLVVPDDFDKIKAQSKVPLEINNAELDTGFTPALAQEADEDMVGYKPGYERHQFDGVAHGFAVRVANASDPVQVAAKQRAFDASLAWIETHWK